MQTTQAISPRLSAQDQGGEVDHCREASVGFPRKWKVGGASGWVVRLASHVVHGWSFCGGNQQFAGAGVGVDGYRQASSLMCISSTAHSHPPGPGWQGRKPRIVHASTSGKLESKSKIKYCKRYGYLATRCTGVEHLHHRDQQPPRRHPDAAQTQTRKPLAYPKTEKRRTENEQNEMAWFGVWRRRAADAPRPPGWGSCPLGKARGKGAAGRGL
ncbi:hypothetical protein EVG20_g10899 [Dentipellis fragilis]|uniref:Uncharacterized protein n=1 Tax=Dentipellis fragilis TaxID=205917 RepID=A0A4Y9XPI0_9AGAM|nr:hypothetical protein EVG20_g10899 [Dentipellis fragilis]